MPQPPDDWHMGSPTLVCPVVGEGKGTGGFSWLSNLQARKMSRFCVVKKISIFSQKSSTLFFFLMWTNFNVFIEFGTILLLLFLCFGFFWLRGIWDLSPLTRDGTCIPSIGRPNLNHWTTREVPSPQLLHFLC